MENGWNLFNFSHTSSTSFGRGHNGSNCTSPAWDISDSATATTSRIDWITSINPHNSSTAVSSSATATHEEGAAAVQALLFANHDHLHYSSSTPSRVYSGGGEGGVGGSHYFPDPHLMCLKLGKRHYFGDVIATPLGDRHAAPPASLSITKKGKPYYDGDTGVLRPSTSAGVSVASPATVPRCQVDGCNVALLNAKDYHKRHKVCEMHSKAPKVVVLGLEQRFCQQCSRVDYVVGVGFTQCQNLTSRREVAGGDWPGTTREEERALRNNQAFGTNLK